MTEEFRKDDAMFNRLVGLNVEQYTAPRRCPSTKTDVTICYQTFGSPSDPCLLLVMGLNGQGALWNEEMCLEFAEKGPFFVVRYDNRDIGLSTKLDKCGSPSILTLLLPACLSCAKPPYTISDMAADGMHLLDHLKVKKAHVFGVSMGGMIAQTMAIEYPDRVASLTSMMSTTGSSKQVDPSLSMKLFLAKKPKSDADTDIALHRIEFFKRCGGPRPFNSLDVYNKGLYLCHRSKYMDGGLRHAFAVVRAPCRVDQLKRLKMPCLVIHGSKDELVPTANGYQTAEAIPGSRLVIIPEMGHLIYPEDHGLLLDEVKKLVMRATWMSSLN